MDDTYHVNFTYQSPTDDIKDSICYNSNGDINIKCSLIVMRNKLMENIEILDLLIKKCNNITCLDVLDGELIKIKLSDNNYIDKLLKDNILKKCNGGYIDYSSNDETNEDRLQLMCNITNYHYDDLFEESYNESINETSEESSYYSDNNESENGW